MDKKQDNATSGAALGILLQHPCLQQPGNLRAVCRLLATSKATAAYLSAALHGRIDLTVSTASMRMYLVKVALTPWLRRNRALLRSLAVDIAQPSDVQGDVDLATIGSHLPTLVSLAISQAAYAEPPCNIPLVSYRATVAVEQALDHICFLPPHHLRHWEISSTEPVLEMRLGIAFQAASRVLRRAPNLTSLLLDVPVAIDFNVANIDLLSSCLLSLGSGCRGLTRLALPASAMPGQVAASVLRRVDLPAGLQELRIGRDFLHSPAGFPDDASYAQVPAIKVQRRQDPVDLSHLTALTSLTCGMAMPLVMADMLPEGLVALDIKQCYAVEPLLQLRSLQRLSLFVHDLPAASLARLTALTALREVHLHIEGAYLEAPEAAEQVAVNNTWTSERVGAYLEAAAQLPTHTLALSSCESQGSSFFTVAAGAINHIGAMTQLTTLVLDWKLDGIALAKVLPNLTRLHSLVLCWWVFDTLERGRAAREYGFGLPDEADARFVAATTDMMKGIAGLPELQQLHWAAFSVAHIELPGLCTAQDEVQRRGGWFGNMLELQQFMDRYSVHPDEEEQGQWG